MAIQVWVSAKHAKEFGCTHHAKFMGLIPGFFSEENGLWVSRSDLLNPIEDALAFIWAAMRQMRGEEPDFMFAIGKPI